MITQYPTSSGRLYLGPKPDREILDYLATLQLSWIWNLSECDDTLIGEESRIARVLCADIPDFGVPDEKTFVDQLTLVCNALRGGYAVFLHCDAAVGRTGMALAAILMTLEKRAPSAALDEARAHTGGPETDEQRRFIRSLPRTT